jgi:hypothetical protein
LKIFRKINWWIWQGHWFYVWYIAYILL